MKRFSKISDEKVFKNVLTIKTDVNTLRNSYSKRYRGKPRKLVFMRRMGYIKGIEEKEKMYIS